MSFFEMRRVPEPEVMDEAGEVEAYSSATGQTYLDQLDDTFVEHAARLVRGCERGRLLDIGTGPGQIVVKLARRLPGWECTGVDRSPKMIAQANASLEGEKELAGRVHFRVGDGNKLEFGEGSFDLVTCNSVLHHAAEPEKLLGEIARAASPSGAILLRDLRRPSRLAFAWHVRWNGRHYSGEMRRLYEDSVRAAYTVEELQHLLDGAMLSGAKVFTHGVTHLGFARSMSS